MKEALLKPGIKKIAKEISQYASKLPSEVKKLNENDKKRYLTDISEYEYLKNSIDYLKKIFSCDINFFKFEEKDIYDPANKKRYAIPLRPAIFIE